MSFANISCAPALDYSVKGSSSSASDSTTSVSSPDEGPARARSNSNSSLSSSVTGRKRKVSCMNLHTSSQSAALQMAMLNLQRMIEEERLGRSTADHLALFEADPTKIHNQLWRERVAKWCYDVLDYLEESRDVAYVAMNFLDRYLAVLSEKKNDTFFATTLRPFEFEVMAFTSLFLAIRVCGVNKDLQIPELLQLSSSGAQTRHVMEAGHHMLKKLSWNHRILTPHIFLKELLELFAASCNSSSEEQALSLVDFASFLVEVSVCDPYFCSVAPSEVALGALVVAITCDANLAESSEESQQGSLAAFAQTVHDLTSLNVESVHMKQIISRLLDVYNQSHEAEVSSSGASNNESSSNLSSSTEPHVILDDDNGIATNESSMLAMSLAEGVIAVDEIRAITPASLDFLHGSSIMQMTQ